MAGAPGETWHGLLAALHLQHMSALNSSQKLNAWLLNFNLIIQIPYLLWYIGVSKYKWWVCQNWQGFLICYYLPLGLRIFVTPILLCSIILMMQVHSLVWRDIYCEHLISKSTVPCFFLRVYFCYLWISVFSYSQVKFSLIPL